MLLGGVRFTTRNDAGIEQSEWLERLLWINVDHRQLRRLDISEMARNTVYAGDGLDALIPWGRRKTSEAITDDL